MKTYELVDGLVKATEGERVLWIPTDPNNSDYAEYLGYTAWVDEGNDPKKFWANDSL
jgi:hypothetical protein